MEAAQQLLQQQQQQMQQQQQQLQAMAEQMQKMTAEIPGQQTVRQQERQEQERRLNDALTAADQRQVRERNEFEQRLQELRAQLATASSSSAARDPLSEAARIIDTRVIGKPDLWHGEKEKFPDWSFTFKGLMVAIDSRYQEIFERVENSVEPLNNNDLDGVNRHLSTQLYYILVVLSRDKAQDKIRKITAGEGFEVWRNISLDYDPKVRTRRVALLIKVLTTKFGGDIGQSLDQFEGMVKE